MVYPACAGIDRRIIRGRNPKGCLPRMRGDRPLYHFVNHHFYSFTPHARGSTFIATIITCCSHVYPACAGIDLGLYLRRKRRRRLPRMRGDRPIILFLLFIDPEFTPHARGSTLLRNSFQSVLAVYPACAGIDLLRKKVYFFARRLPRMRGDRPCTSRMWSVVYPFTPHARGSTATCQDDGVW